MSAPRWTQDGDTWTRCDGAQVRCHGLGQWHAIGPTGTELVDRRGFRRCWAAHYTAQAAVDDEIPPPGSDRWSGPEVALTPDQAGLVRAILDRMPEPDAAPLLLGRVLRLGAPAGTVHPSEAAAGLVEALEATDRPSARRAAVRIRTALAQAPEPVAEPEPAGPWPSQQPARQGRRPEPARAGSLRDQLWAWIEDPAHKQATLGELAAAFGLSPYEALAVRDGRGIAHGHG